MLNKKLLIKVFIPFCFLSFIWGAPAKAEGENIQIEAKSGLLMEANSGKLLFEKNSNEKYAPASVTKIMTMLLAMEAIDSGKIKFEDKITASENAKKMGGSTMLLDTGEIRTVEEIIKGIAIASGNDAAVAMAEFLGGTEGAFVEMMNKRAAELGMKNTTFKNCTGLPVEGHVTTAMDIAIMSRELLKHPKILKYTGTYMETISEGRKSPIELVNHNKLVRFFSGCDGLKTGFTDEAKYCISATAMRDGVRVISVIMGAPTYKIRNRDASMLLNYGFSKFESKKLIVKDQELKEVKLNKKGDRYFIAKAADDLSVTVERGSNQEVVPKITIDKGRKEYKKGEIVGACDYYINNVKVGSVKLYSDREVKKSGLLNNMKDNLKGLFKNGI